MASINIDSASAQSSGSDAGSYRFALMSLTSLFFMWGFITCLNDILIPHLKNIFDLNYTQAMLIQFCFFGAYFIMSVPAGILVNKIGYKSGIVVGLVVAGLGCLLFYPAAAFEVYGFFLGALFVLASGITVLQVSANPYVTALGPANTASSRLTMTQAFNSLGTTIAPFFGALLILGGMPELSDSASAADIAAYKSAEAEAVQMPYVMLASALFVLAAIFAWLKLPSMHTESTDTAVSNTTIWQYPHLVLGAIGIFVYVGGEVAIGSFLVNFLGEPHVAAMKEAEAAHYIAYYWGGAMIGRFIGAVVMSKIDAGKVLAFNATAAALLVLVAMNTSGDVAMWSILAVGLFNSVMFPTIFSLAIHALGPNTSKGSGLLCLAIVGGAILPLVQGMLADSLGLTLSFVLPVFCYLYIVFYGLKGSRYVPVDQSA